MFIKRMQLSLIHVAVAMTLVPINSTLNRVMIKEMALSATFVAVLASFPYLFSPMQMVIGSFSDRHPWFGYRRTPYIALGLILCALGVMIAPQVVFILPENWWLGMLLSFLTFAAWGMGFNLASVSYLALASELSGEKDRSRTVSIMWFMMIVGIILTAATLSRLLTPYSDEVLKQAFEMVGLAALVIGGLGLAGLEPRLPRNASVLILPQRQSWKTLGHLVLANSQAKHFFFYLVILLAAILGQDVLLEPFGAEAFGLSVDATTRITSIWGGCVLLALLAANWLEKRWRKQTVAGISAWVAIAGFVIIAISAPLASKEFFYAGVVFLGFGTGMATVSNLSLMLDMTTTRIGLFIGVWGMADAFARLVGTLMSGFVRDLVTVLTRSSLSGYMIVFSIEAAMLVASWWMLQRIDVNRFKEQTKALTLSEQAAFMNDAG